MSTEPSEVDEATRAADEEEARAAHEADRQPTEHESELADQNENDPEVATHFEEMARTGAEIKGEGEVA